MAIYIIVLNSNNVEYVTDTKWLLAGPGIPQHTAPADSSTNGLGYIMPNSEFLGTGDLQFFEFYATATGAVTFMVCASAIDD